MYRLTTQLFTLLVLLAFTVPAATLAAADSEPKPPREIAQDTVHDLLAAMEGRRDELRNNPAELDALVDRILVPLVDVDYMSQLVLGRYWRDASEEQRKRFQEAFKTMLVRTYGNALLDFDKEQIDYQPVRAPEGAERITFRATVTTSSGDKVPVNLDMHLVDNEWKVYDGQVGNLSFVTNYRSQFSSYIKKHGLEALITQMEKRYGGAN